MIDYELYLRAVLSLGVVLFLIIALAFMIRKYGTAMRMRGGKGTKRLAVLEVQSIDPRRRLVLVRRDGVEHLLMTGGPNDVVVEAGINTAVAIPIAPPEPAATEEMAPANGFRRQLDQVRF